MENWWFNMLPHNHFLIASIVITLVGILFFPEKSIMEIGRWVLIGGLLSAAIDLDVCALTLLKSKKENRLKPFRNPIEIFRKFNQFMDAITETGVLKTGLKIHLISSILLILISYFFMDNYFIPVTLGVVSHLISDIPNLQRLVKLSL